MIVDEQIYLEHFGVKGMKWGVRRAEKRNQIAKMKYNQDLRIKSLDLETKKLREEHRATVKQDLGRKAKKGAIVAGGILLVVGAVKVNSMMKNRSASKTARIAEAKRVTDALSAPIKVRFKSGMEFTDMNQASDYAKIMKVLEAREKPRSKRDYSGVLKDLSDPAHVWKL